MNIIKVFLILVIILLLGFNNTPAERYIGMNTTGSPVWSSSIVEKGAENIAHLPNNILEWYLSSNGAGNGNDYADTQKEIQKAFTSWTNVSTSNLTFQHMGSNNSWGNDGKNTHYWADDAEDSAFDGPLASRPKAMTVITVNSLYEIIDVDVVYNSVDNDWEMGIYEHNDIQSTAVHEIGHSFGLHHVGYSEPVPVMYPYRSHTIDRRTIRFDDKKGISFLYGGRLIDNETFSGADYYKWDITVDPNTTLTINSGSEITFQNSSSLIVNGTLDVNGTSSNRVTFDFVSSSSNGIEINDNATADISNAIVKNAYKGLYIDEAYINMNNTDFIDCDYGLYLYRTNYASSQPDITNCTVYKSSYNGSGTGVYLKYSSPIILNTEVYNYYTGIGSIYNSSPLLGHYTSNGNNNIHNNYKNIHAISSSNPFLGSASYGGYNTLRYYTNYNIVAQTNCNITAENNYWGTTSSSSIANGINAYSGCSVDYEPFLYWNPNGNIALPPAKLSANKTPSVTSVATDLSSIHDLILRDKLEEALALCNSFISESKETSNILYAIDLLWQIERKLKLQKGKSNIDLFANLRTNSKNELVAGYSNLIAAVGGKSDRIVSLNNVLSNYGSSEIIEKGVIYSRFSYYLNEEVNKEKAEGEYKLLKEKYPNAPITEEVLLELNNGNSIIGQNSFSKKSDTVLDEKITDFALFVNYPNPFNPTTTIAYQIPNDGFVNLVVYNTLGQVVTTLVNEHQTSGKYSVQFNASNFPSGVYFYKIESGNFTKVNKMLLLR